MRGWCLGWERWAWVGVGEGSLGVGGEGFGGCHVRDNGRFGEKTSDLGVARLRETLSRT